MLIPSMASYTSTDMPDSNTRLSLLLALKQEKQQEEAWEAFVRLYGSRIYEWCLNRQLSPGDAEDVSQNVLIKVAIGIRNFQYDPNGSFRGWLRRITENAIHDFIGQQRRQRASDFNDAYNLLDLAESREELTSRMEAAFDFELLEKAVELVRCRVSEKRFLAWEMTARQGVGAAEVACTLDMNIATVYTAKKRVQQFLKEEIQQLENNMNLGNFGDY
ncbi:MAG: sigma-70 family RNA polymerase sigma factor [Pirellulaceae bacterium]